MTNLRDKVTQVRSGEQPEAPRRKTPHLRIASGPCESEANERPEAKRPDPLEGYDLPDLPSGWCWKPFTPGPNHVGTLVGRPLYPHAGRDTPGSSLMFYVGGSPVAVAREVKEPRDSSPARHGERRRFRERKVNITSTVKLQTPISDQERALIRSAAERTGQSMAAFTRDILVDAARKTLGTDYETKG